MSATRRHEVLTPYLGSRQILGTLIAVVLVIAMTEMTGIARFEYDCAEPSEYGEYQR